MTHDLTPNTGIKNTGAPISSPPDERALLDRLARRVRTARDALGLSRKALSEAAGLSPRYLAQLEGGEGNISIVLLSRLAWALGQPVEALVGDGSAPSPEALALAHRLEAAPPALRARMLALLDDAERPDPRAGRVALIGLRGAGKSTLGALSAKRLSVPFVELNQAIEDAAGMPLTEVMAFYGTEGYRRLEAQALGAVIDGHDRVILAVAGGIVAEPETLSVLMSRFHTIWLQARPEEHMERVRRQGDLRPMAGNPKAMEQLRAILASREALYAQAEASLDTSGHSVPDSLDALIDLIDRRGFLGAA